MSDMETDMDTLECLLGPTTAMKYPSVRLGKPWLITDVVLNGGVIFAEAGTQCRYKQGYNHLKLLENLTEVTGNGNKCGITQIIASPSKPSIFLGIMCYQASIRTSPLVVDYDKTFHTLYSRVSPIFVHICIDSCKHIMNMNKY